MAQRKCWRRIFDKKGHTPVDVILTNKTTRDGNSIALTQSHYTGNLLIKFNYYDISPLHVFGRFSRYTDNPNMSYWTALERLLKYLKGTIDYIIHCASFPTILEGYSNDNWIIDLLEN